MKRWTMPFESVLDMLCFGAPSGESIHDRRRTEQQKYFNRSGSDLVERIRRS